MIFGKNDPVFYFKNENNIIYDSVIIPNPVRTWDFVPNFSIIEKFNRELYKQLHGFRAEFEFTYNVFELNKEDYYKIKRVVNHPYELFIRPFGDSVWGTSFYVTDSKITQPNGVQRDVFKIEVQSVNLLTEIPQFTTYISSDISVIV